MANTWDKSKNLPNNEKNSEAAIRAKPFITLTECIMAPDKFDEIKPKDQEVICLTIVERKDSKNQDINELLQRLWLDKDEQIESKLIETDKTKK